MSKIIDIIKYATNAPRNDGVLHFSSHLQHDRHTVLYYEYGYPKESWNRPWMNTLPLLQGTAIHEQVHKIMSEHHTPYASEVEVKCDDFQYPWVGTVDAYTEDEYGNLMLIDYKTISGTSFGFLDGPKAEHVMQVSAYYHFGMPGVHSVGVLYLPTTPDYKRRWPEPVMYYVTPHPKEALIARINEVEAAISAYKAASILPAQPDGEVYWKENKRNKNWELHYKPHYSTMFCPWKNQEDDPCGCSEEVPVHIGSWSEDRIEGDESIVKGYLSECPGWTA